MPRFAFYSHSTGSLHVVAATKKAAAPLLRELWSNADPSKEAKFEPGKIRLIGEKKFRWGPRPQCCKKARLRKDAVHHQPLIQLSTDYFHEDEKRPEKPPYWSFSGHRIKY